ncbi:TRAM domain-containing protein [Halorubrum sp. Atlit-26R]|uniref:TRAM domain-containing protein n=1 Tax=Halorubrum sp. Atlit-26R TaxID=2282128 RepID=UPI000EF1BCCD|nr:TRAM domain-containing protein [Halorubrum sp. Atlit-26R]RLM68615.1 TRAM domain-containing protein [Halorubrum sp. Atlit-26R]
MEISDSLQTLYSAKIEEQDGSYHIEVPKREIVDGAVEPTEPVKVALLSHPNGGESRDVRVERGSSTGTPKRNGQSGTSSHQDPPVTEGEIRKVEIENIGDQGDGIAKVERGFVVIVPGGRVGEEPRVRIDEVKENVAFAEIA